MSDHEKDFTASAASDVEIVAFGIAGTAGRFAAPLAQPPNLSFAHEAFWIANPPRDEDVHAGFVADFQLAAAGEVRIRVIAPAAYRLMVDGNALAWGPLRFAPAMPEYQECAVNLPAGAHRASLHVHHEGLTTRLAAKMPAFVWAELSGDFTSKPQWFGRHLSEYLNTGLRVSPLQGWMEWKENAQEAEWYTENPAAGSPWAEVVPVPGLEKILGCARASLLPVPAWPSVVPREESRGRFRDICTGYRFDDPAVAFMTSDPSPDPAKGIDGYWIRLDLGRIRIGALEFDVVSDQGGEATIAYAENKGPDGRPMPVVALSTGPTHFLQKFAFGPGTTPVRPLQSLGGRYLEVRLATGGQAAIMNVRFRERASLGPQQGRLTLHDELLDRIWQTGLDTMHSSAEDAAVDSVRERGEWVGDASLAGAELMSVGWDNLALMRRVLYHAAAAAREDGLVAGCGPGELIYLGTYAAQWINSCLRCAELEGSTELLSDLEGAARRNVEALLACIDGQGKHRLPWSFIDWGYIPTRGEIEIPVLAHAVSALDAWARWQTLLGRGNSTLWQEKTDDLRNLIRQAATQRTPGYHAAVLAERIGAMERGLAADIALRQLRSSFPCNPAAKRLRDPTQASPDVVTPYFTNFSIDLLLRAGKTDEVLEIWRKAWGWMLESGATTWWEVFDDRWSHCHYWAGAPTWQMTRRIIGIDPTLHEGRPVIRLAVYPGSLSQAAGRLPFPGTGWADISWRREGDSIAYRVDCPAAWTLLRGDTAQPQPAGTSELRLSAAGHAFVP